MTVLLQGGKSSNQATSTESSSDNLARSAHREQTIAISATFTAEPVEETLAFWMQELAMPSFITFAPYNQLFQQLLDPASLLSQNRRGINVILLRFEDWQRFDTDVEPGKVDIEKIERYVYELRQALQKAARHSAIPHVVCICPASPVVETNAQYQAFFARMEDQLAKDLAAVGGVYIIKSTEITSTYPVDEIYNPYGDKIGHIPYTPLFFAVLGTFLARKIYALVSTPYKVIVLDCDQTLWRGVCAEDGALGVVIDPSRVQLQEFLVAQQAAGVLLCLASKNNERDVFDVFDSHPDMRLKREHLVAWRINWQPKSQNLQSLAEELQLSLESFIFIDDSPVECAEVQSNCPEVLVLPLPQDLGRLPRLLQHFWAFDHLRVTAEDKKRTELYVQQVQRKALQRSSSTLRDFLEGLQLQVDITPMEKAKLSRVAQLTQRTNQFNCTTIRRTESEVQQFCALGGECLVVEVIDRFGDYGLVGVILFTVEHEELKVDTFLLSCRVLGRGVEHQMLAKLGEIAHRQGAARVIVPFIATLKNAPARKFLESTGVTSELVYGDQWNFSLACESLNGFAYDPPTEKSTLPEAEPGDKTQSLAANTNGPVVSTPIGARKVSLLRIATELSTAEQVLQAIVSQRQHYQGDQRQVDPARTEVEEHLVEIWAEVLKLGRIGIHDDFFGLGGSSLHAAQIATHLFEKLHIEIPLRYFFEAPTVAQLAEVVSGIKAQASIPDTEEENPSSRVPIITVRASGSRPPFFFLHGQWTGAPLYCWEFARYLGPDQPLYLLEPYRFDDQPVPPSLEAMVATYITSLRTIQPEGPYFLGGWCNGGLVAYEIARQLHSQGQSVELLVLMDPDPPVSRWKWDRGIINGLGNLFRIPIEKQVDCFLLYRHLRLAFHYWRLNKLKHMNASGQDDSEIARRAMKTKLQELKALFPGHKALRQEWLATYDWVASGYEPYPYTGKITLFWTDQESRLKDKWDKAMKTKIEAEKVEFHRIPGNHMTSRTRYLPVLAEHLRDCVNKAHLASLS